MTSRDFCYWLQGHFEVRGEPTSALTADQVQVIRNHLSLVFKHEIDPSIARPGTPEASALDAIHSGKWPKMPPMDYEGAGLIRC